MQLNIRYKNTSTCVSRRAPISLNTLVFLATNPSNKSKINESRDRYIAISAFPISKNNIPAHANSSADIDM